MMTESIQVSTSLRRRGMDLILGRMEASIMANGLIIKLMALVNMNGQTVGNTKETGKIMLWKV